MNKYIWTIFRTFDVNNKVPKQFYSYIAYRKIRPFDKGYITSIFIVICVLAQKTCTVSHRCITLYARRAEINNTTSAIMGKVYAIRSALDQLTRRCKHEKIWILIPRRNVCLKQP